MDAFTSRLGGHLSALDALERLREGNRRFESGVRSPDTLMSQRRRHEFVAGQQPFAVILGCSDSRVPVEIVFDQGLGDLFVIRVAGNIVASSQIGSVEFAAEKFGTRLVVVLGHTGCGAVEATLAELQRPTENQFLQAPGIRSLSGRTTAKGTSRYICPPGTANGKARLTLSLPPR